MIPQKRLAALFVVPLILSLGTLFFPSLFPVILYLDAALLVVALFDLLTTTIPTIESDFQIRDVLSIAQNNPAKLIVTSHCEHEIVLKVRADLPEHLSSPEMASGAHLTVTLPSHVAREVRYHIHPTRRGEYTLGNHVFRHSSRFGLWEKQAQFPTRRTVHVYPDLAMIRTYELLARKHRQSALVRTSHLRGGESEFARLRDYSKDDDYRFIDWKASARRNRLTTREYQLESDQNVFIMLDAGRLMTGHVEGLSQFDHALNSALLMAHIGLRGGDRVGLMCFDEDVRTFLPPQGGTKTASRLVRATYQLEPTMTESSYQDALGIFFAKQKQRCLVILFTQIQDGPAVSELSAQLLLLSRKHLPLVVVQEDSDLLKVAEGPIGSQGTAKELYDRGAAAELLCWKRDALLKLKAAGAHVIETPTRGLNNRTINRYLEIKAQRLL